ncbi:NAD(P)H-binding protein [Nitrospirillum sp. BR 11828]|uniref:NAD(P)H-binding protein n=1 Tax=Nitrospirillum sp. BR 11828 TaxID=3104325 RepID=UPI002ACA2657|nr:NAD(P)H-binding protein [Nitrospirillum sp. BR 11828]MDZ5646850.1 NAD(P)H-binding protein [Nitrospirillum sp. BR 11828]
MDTAAGLRVLLAGGTGLVGGHTLGLLLKSPKVAQVVSLVRKPTGMTHPKLRELVVDFATLGDLPPDVQVDAVLCALGTTRKEAGSDAAFQDVDLKYVVAVGKAARRAGATFFGGVSSVDADSTSRHLYLKTKGMMEDYVATLGFTSRHFLRPSLLLGKRRQDRPLERLFQALAPIVGPFLGGRLEKYRPIPATVVAAALVTTASQPAIGGVRTHEYSAIRSLAGL